MAGIYIHIPFCKQACSYCDFHFSTSIKYKEEMVQAILQEISMRQDFLNTDFLQTIYFGGGTPSLLSSSDINRILDRIASIYDLSELQEVTLEANPDDLNIAYLQSLRSTLINRLSIGIQSFVDADLQLMNRSHNALEAEYAIKRSQDIGLENISCDLIFGTPTLSRTMLKENIQKLSDWEIPHISAYSLTIEDRTVLAAKMQKGTFTPSSESIYEAQMLQTMQQLADNGYEQYEISNYARNGQYAIHNTNYWKGVSYLGIGPSAHAFDGKKRSWNVRNNAQYIKSILVEKTLPSEYEILNIKDKINEQIMVSLRTKWGLDLENVADKYGDNIVNHLLAQVHPFIQDGKVLFENKKLTLSIQGKLMADHISSELFVVD